MYDKYKEKYCGTADPKILNYTEVTSKDENTLWVLADLQLASTSLRGGSKYFRFYKRGILYTKSWETILDREVLVVGYGIDHKKEDN